ncbi:hypothetical protein CAPTEDRAFT_115186, partial [Capitella teleta]
AVMKIVITGASGRMGQTLVRLALEDDVFTLHGLTDHAQSAIIGADAGQLVGKPPLGLSVSHDLLPLMVDAQGIVDFSVAKAVPFHAELAAQARIPYVLGTTGLDESEEKALKAAASHCPIVRSGNMSLGVNLLANLVEQAAKALGPDFDIEVLEMHHKHKVDAPSGTALLLGEAAAKGRGVRLEEQAVYARQGQVGERPEGTIGFATLRGGSVVGEHDVIFAGQGERLVLSHKAEDRSVFARGALKALLWAQDKSPGLYSMRDVLGLND